MQLTAVIALCGAVCLADARLLQQHPAAITAVKGHQPAGLWALTGFDADAGAVSSAKGVRYNGGTITMAGDGAPGPIAQGMATDSVKGRTRSGNTMAEANTNLGREVIAATSEGARAVAGSGVSDILDNPSAHPASSGNSHSFKARHIDNRGSHAFTDIAGTSSAIVGPGNGPAALAYGNEVAAFARSHRTSGLLGGPQDGFNQ